MKRERPDKLEGLIRACDVWGCSATNYERRMPMGGFSNRREVRKTSQRFTPKFRTTDCDPTRIGPLLHFLSVVRSNVKELPAAVVLASLVLAIALVWHAQTQRYQMAQANTHVVIRLDTRTGETMVCDLQERSHASSIECHRTESP